MAAKLIFKELYIFDGKLKMAKKIEFSPRKTIITSNISDGTDRGKSVIMKSLYHTLGADCEFRGRWDERNTIYILNFSIDTTNYYMYRHSNLFKCFDGQKNLLFSCVSRHELAEKLDSLFHFAVKLPSRGNPNDNTVAKRLEITPPAYNYIIYYLDQDGQRGAEFASFKSLHEYADFKENVLLYHFGAFDDTYYELSQEQAVLIAKQNQLIKEQEIIHGMLERVYEGIRSVSYSKDLEHLRQDVSRAKNEYNEIAQRLSNLRKALIRARNTKRDIERDIDMLKHLEKTNERQIGSLKNHVCPFCKSEIGDSLNLRIKQYGVGDDIILLSGDMQISLQEVDRDISRLEAEYSHWLEMLDKYEVALNLKAEEINDVLKHQGYIEIKDKLGDDLHSVEEELSLAKDRLANIKVSLRKYTDAKKKINARYYELMLASTTRFGLEGISPKRFENIKSSFSDGGSNNPISTIIWYITLLQLKHEFNPDSIYFPVVLDSPNNAETDDQKREQTYSFISEQITENQLIVSGIGFDSDESKVRFDKVIVLENDKYHLLCEQDYTLYHNLLEELTAKQSTSI